MSLKRYIPIFAAAALVVALQIALSASGYPYYMTQIIMSAYYALVVIGLCLLMGYAGQVSLGHAGFFAIGGYISAALTTCNLLPWRQNWAVGLLSSMGVLIERQDLYGQTLLCLRPWPAFLAAMLLAIAIAFVIGIPVIRLKGHYLAMATLGFGLIVYRIVLGAAVFGLADGISNVPAFELLPGLKVSGASADRIQNYYIAWGAVLAAMTLAINLVHSRVGRALRSIHQSEEAAHSLGVNTYQYKLYTFVLSALLAAAGGALLTHYNGSIGPSEATVMKSVRYVAIVAVGGMANLWGALLMGVGLNFLSLRGVFGSYDDAVFGVILIGMMLFAPEGLLSASWMSFIWGPVRAAMDRVSGFGFRVSRNARLRDPIPETRYPTPGGGDPPPSGNHVFFETRSLHRFFGGLHAVDDISFTVASGTIKALIGPNGAGKTTLFNLIAGTLPPHRGQVLFRGRTITAWKPHAIAAMGIARTFQSTKLFGQMSVLENVMMGRHPRTRSGFLAGMLNLPSTWREQREIERSAMAILEDFGLVKDAFEISANLSFGRQRLVELARALATEPTLLLLDEPAAGLNIYETQELANLIVRIRDRGVTCLVVEHDMSLVMSISDDVVVLDQGRKIAEGPPRTIQRNADVIRIYLGEDHAEDPQP